MKRDSYFNFERQDVEIKKGNYGLNDLWSQFTTYISPAFHHEKPERSLSMKLYHLRKGEFLLLLTLFILCFLIALLLGFAGPSSISEHVERGSNVFSSSSQFPIGPYNIRTPQLNVYRQQLWLSVQILTSQKNMILTKRLTTTLEVQGLETSKSFKRIGSLKNITLGLKCVNKNCEPLILLHISPLKYSHYQFQVLFSSELLEMTTYLKISDVFFTIYTFNPTFTKMKMWFRLFCALLTLVITVVFEIRLFMFSVCNWSIEQMGLSLLLPLLFFFNNPLFTATILSSSILPGVLEVIFKANFLFFLLFFWLCIYHGLRQNNRGFITFYLPKVLLVSFMWLTGLTMAMIEEINQIRDPTFNYQSQRAHYSNFQRVFIGCLALYIVYLVYLMFRAFGELRSLNILDSRLKFHSGSLTLVLIMTLALLISKYGSGILEDNFVARLYTSYDSEAIFLAFYTLINSYIFILAYVYSPVSNNCGDSQIIKDNPSFSMMNDSDEEIEAMLVSYD